MAEVTVAATSIRRAWRQDGDGSFWLRFRATGGDGDATAAFTEAVVAANDAVEEGASDGPVGISTDVPVDTPKGPVLFVAFCDTTELLDEWLAVVVQHLEHAGWRGKLTAAKPDASPVDAPGGELLGIAAGLVLRIDHEAATAYKRETGFSMGWFVDEATTRQVVDHAPDFCLDGPGDVYLRFGFVQFRVQAADVPR